ncbi:MAG: hypothetical protein KDE35_00455 [Geminicoccaceae bacterium]|nr:hypothetical protein [Geminicoccaceae bacterium]
MSRLFEQLNVARIVNAKGTATRLSGGVMHPEVAQAMVEATRLCVDLATLQAAAGACVARHTGAASGLVTSGCAAGLLLGAAACITRLDPGRMARLPDTGDVRPEAVVVRSQRNQYDHALRTTGLRLIEVGLPDRYAGAGCRDAEAWEIAEAIGPRTVLVFHVADASSRPSLEETVAVAHERGVPVLVDAAAELPPKANLRRFIEAGADLVAFSGGKALGGPQASGMLCGDRELIAAAALQMLDMDYPLGAFRPPSSYIDAGALCGLPPHGIGRPCKVGKEQIAGLITALEMFVAEEDETRTAHWTAVLEEVAGRIGRIDGLEVTLRPALVPTLELRVGSGAEAASRLRLSLLDKEPAVHLDQSPTQPDRLVINPLCLVEGDAGLIAAALRG